jgi:hypothetical protein
MPDLDRADSPAETVAALKLVQRIGEVVQDGTGIAYRGNGQ